MGASFIHGPDVNNPVVKLNHQFNLPIADTDYTGWLAVRENDSVPYNETSVEAAAVKMNTAFKAVEHLSSDLEKDISVHSALRQVNQYQLIEDPLSQTFLAEHEFFFGDTVDTLSTKYLYDGYLESLLGNRRAISVLKDRPELSDGSSSTYPPGPGSHGVDVQEDKRVVIKCRNGQNYEADAVIVTLPLGVLKTNDVKFTPGLSTKKKGAIKRVGFGTVNKLVLEFNQQFWPNDTHHITVAKRDNAERGKFSILSSFQPIVHKPVIVTYAVSQIGEESETLSDAELKDIALSRLRTAFGTSIDNATIVNLSRTNWKNDRFSRGSYSFPALGIKAGDWEALGEAEPPLFFAGEHTQAKQYGTVLSAIETGRRAAAAVETYLKSDIAASVNVSYILIPAVNQDGRFGLGLI
ncbi:uncharacterized protein LOC135465326 [Liolophura sinensis]|uniref:uncharacterized protein LOC135465326 n=1 Tax=Liolophura sinensis TaxID=3198878 RepID=UPI003159640E